MSNYPKCNYVITVTFFRLPVISNSTCRRCLLAGDVYPKESMRELSYVHYENELLTSVRYDDCDHGSVINMRDFDGDNDCDHARVKKIRMANL